MPRGTRPAATAPRTSARNQRLRDGRTIGQLMVNPQLYNSLNGATTEINALVADVRKEPKKFLRIKLAIF